MTSRQGCRKRQRLLFSQDHDSKLASYLIESWAWGRLSPRDVQKIAELALLDVESALEQQCGLEDLRVLSSLGSRGSHPNNCSRDLERALSSNTMPDPYSVMLPLANNSGRGFKEFEQRFLLPHDLFALLFKDYNAAFQKHVCPG